MQALVGKAEIKVHVHLLSPGVACTMYTMYKHAAGAASNRYTCCRKQDVYAYHFVRGTALLGTSRLISGFNMHIDTCTRPQKGENTPPVNQLSS